MTIRTLAWGACIGLITAICWGQATAPATVPATGPTTTAAGGLGNYLHRPLAEPRLELPASIGRGDALKGMLYLPDAVPLLEAKVFARVSDSLGRLLVDREIPLLLPRPREGGAIVIPLEIALGPVIAIQHTLAVRVAGGGREYTASRAFLVTPPRAWDDYICGIWQRHNPKRVPYLQQMYLSWSQWSGTGVTVPEPWLAADYRYYVESTGNWVYSPYHIHMEGKPKTHYFTEAKEAFKKDRTNLTNLERQPCLSDRIIRGRIEQQFANVARLNREASPIFYTVADEPGIGDQAAPFDFCFSQHCRHAFRQWLQKRYKSLEELNKQWGSKYADWNDVRGATTDEIFARKDDNFSAWCDHKEFMDDVLVDAYAIAKAAALRIDPAARIGMGGGQGPSAVGGWDYWKISQIMDVMEAYYIGNNYEMFRSFNPAMIPFHCSFVGPNVDAEKHLIWYLFIHGDRGLLVWDDKSDFVDDNGKYSETAKAFTPLYKELTGGLGMLRIASERVTPEIEIYHSQASMRVHWIQEVRPSGEKWINRGSSAERVDSRYFRLRESWTRLIEDNGLQYNFTCLEKGIAETTKVLILPEILTLSDAEAEKIKQFVGRGGTVIADKLPGDFDEHGRKREASALEPLFKDGAKGRAIFLNRDMLGWYHERLKPDGNTELLELVRKHLDQAEKLVASQTLIADSSGKFPVGVEMTTWRNGEIGLIALHRNPLLRINELGPQEYKSNKRFEEPLEVTLRLAQPFGRHTVPMAAYNVRTGQFLGQGADVKIAIRAFEPVILAIMETVPGNVDMRVRDRQLEIRPRPPAGASAPVYHLDFIGPDGQERLIYRKNVIGDRMGLTYPLPLALNDPEGEWTVKVREVHTGREQSVKFSWQTKRP